MLVPARPLDITHTVDTDTVDDLLQGIREDPPPLRRPKDIMKETIVVNPSEQEG